MHFTELDQFKVRLNDGDFMPYEKKETLEDFLLMIGTLIHCSDLYVPSLDVPVSEAWATLVNKEFMNQSRVEE